MMLRRCSHCSGFAVVGRSATGCERRDRYRKNLGETAIRAPSRTVAQRVGAHGIQDVEGSTPFGSTCDFRVAPGANFNDGSFARRVPTCLRTRSGAICCVLSEWWGGVSPVARRVVLGFSAAAAKLAAIPSYPKGETPWESFLGESHLLVGAPGSWPPSQWSGSASRTRRSARW